MTLWKSRIDCWYEPAKKIVGEKPYRFIRWVLVEAENSEAAIKAAVQWAGDTAPMFGVKWLSFEHRETLGPIKLPFELHEEQAK
jgi:hypothetical protein